MIILLEVRRKEAQEAQKLTKISCGSCASLWLRFVERRVVSQSQHRLTNRGEDLIVVVVTNVKREISIYAFQSARPDQTTRTTRANALFHRVFREVFDDVSRATAGDLRFNVTACFPQMGHVFEPEVRSLDVHRHLPDVVL